ncbi:MAG: aminomethyl-transferring glycine dehydrogenase subunit GcvPA, partial [candidate division Zixibacteria bacterium]|nr:aminomethyl-transferring glycine dehydrogenase subunit GcvPA [candidate division Zixibacteria bacterium]
PYQAEVAQGTLQVTYEFQSHICRLTGMEVANASMYDGATATAEAAAMSMGVTRRFKVVMSESVNPLYRQVIETYLIPRDVELVTVPMAAGRTDLDRLKTVVDDKTSCVILGQPNFFGLIEEASDVADIIHAVGGHCIMTVDPIAQAILKTPADCGADIVTGEGQPMGIPLSYGGPLVGFLAATKKLIRNMPGRIVARTHDVDGNPGFVLTLQTREQHIRRDKATSNICTSQALCATMAAVHMTLLGRTGLKRVALLSAEKAQKAAAALCALEGFEPYFEGPFVREFAIRTPKPAGDMIQALTANGILAGIDAGRWYEGMDDCLVVALTEKRTDADIEALVRGLEELAASGILSRM